MSDFGARLRAARERRGITLREISDHTKISIAALQALEASDASRLPGGIFARSFVRSYAFEVGLDPDDLLREFLERFGDDPRFEVMSSAPVPSQPDDSRQPAGTILKILAASVVVAIILYLALMSRRAGDESTASRTESPRTSRRLASR